MWAQVSFVLSQSTRFADGRTDGQTSGSWLYRALHYTQSHGKNWNFDNFCDGSCTIFARNLITYLFIYLCGRTVRLAHL